jgi:hypothetical protein
VTFVITRRCTKCGQFKPLNKSITFPKFICADCKPK